MSFRRLSTNAVASIGQVLASALLLFELYRFLTRQLGPEQIGVWSLVVATTAMARLSEFGLGGGVTKFVAGDLGAGEGARAARTVSMALVAIGLLLGAVCSVLMPVLHAALGVLIEDPALLASGRALLPYALASLWLGSLSGVLLSALDGSQRSTLRALVLTAAGAVQIAAAHWLVPSFGLLAMGPVQLMQAGFVLIVAAALTWRVLGQPAAAWLGWERGRFVEILRYGGGVQIGAVGQLLFEPTVKAFLAIFGGLSAIGYFEMANRAVTQFRAVIVSAYQMLVPYLAALAGAGGLSRAQMRHVHRSAFALLLVLATPYYAVLAAALPAILSLWLGRYDSHFVQIGLLCLLGWYLNTLTVPAYMLYLSTGRLRWTMLAQLAIGGLNLLLAGIGGWCWGGFGVVGGAMLALVAGSAVVPLAFRVEYGLPARDWWPAASAPLVLFCVAGALPIVVTTLLADAPFAQPALPLGAVAGFAFGCTWLALRHPVCADLRRRLWTPV